MKDRQSSDAANSGKSGGCNMQGENFSVDRHTCGSMGGSGDAPPKGTSNGGK
jgi:hypothetical protein